MAESLASIAVEKLTQVLGQQLSLFAGATGELEKLKRTFESIQALLADAETKQVDSKSVNLWLLRLRAVAYDIDDLLDDWVVSGLEGEDEAERDDDDVRSKVRDCLLSPYTGLDHVASRYKIALRISEIRERLDQIDREKNQYNFRSSSGDGQGQLVSSRPPTGSQIEVKMIGRDQDKVEIINMLVNGSSNEDGQVRVAAIVGIGGQGKTTLAREIYNDKSLQVHFDLISWACVTEIFDATKVIKAILDDLKVNTTAHELSPLQKELRDKLDGKRFLVILDDVWNEEEEKWNPVRACLTSGVAGSRILVTTRKQEVATAVGAVYIRELQCLSEDDSWSLFSDKAFVGRNDKDRSDLQDIARKIVSKCRGVPLSIKVMGSVMNGMTSAEDWQNTLESGMWSLPEAENKILPALWLSYYNLPPPLKQCFAYCSIYKKDEVMAKDELVKLWVAQGFIHAKGVRKVEDIAAGHFDGLVARSMFQKAESDGSYCTMHDLLHDLAELITEDETYVYVGDKSNQCPANIRHASLLSSKNNPNINFISSRGAKTLRTLFLHDVDKTDTSLDNLFQQARFLRALVFRGSKIKKLPRTIWKLKHLRYLDLSFSWIMEFPNIISKMKHLKYLELKNSELREVPNVIGKLKQLAYLDLSYLKMVELPESVSYLHNLHTLKLNDCSKLKILPRGMGGMIGLRHLEIVRTDSLEYLPEGMGRMTSLKTLSKFIVGGEGGCEVNELQQLNCLQGSLVVQNLDKVSSTREACKAKLQNKPNLRRLVLEMSAYRVEAAAASGRDDAEIERMDGILQGLRPHENLEELELDCNRRNLKFPSWLEDLSFTKLTKLKIQGFVIRCEQNNLPGLGKLPALKYLSLVDIDLKKVGHEFYYGNNSTDVFARGIKSVFPELEQLIFKDMPELEEWELMSKPNRNVIIMPRLSTLKLENCPKLTGLPNHLANAPLTNLVISGCQRLKRIECSSSFSLLEKINLRSSSEFFSSGLPHLPKLKKLLIREIKTLPNEGWERSLVLQKLQIRNCFELKSLPDGLTQLQSLENLEIDGCCKIESLPDGLGQLKKLQSLELNGLQLLTYLPNSLGQLESLEHLHVLDSKKLQSLPEGLEQLKILKSLKISNAEELTCLPNSLAQLELLEELDISGLKKLESLPEGLEGFKKLKSLEIRDVEMMTCLPNSLGQLKSLEKLYINCLKNLQSLPQELGQLKKLKSLTIEGAEELTCLPDSLWQLESLEDFEIYDLAKLESLPQELGQLKRLKSLTIEGAEELTCLPDSLWQLESLEDFEIYGLAKLESLPQELGQLKKLKWLTIKGAEELTCLPDSLWQLESLEGFQINGLAKLESLPHSLVQLKKLENLAILNMEGLANLPQSLEQLQSLKTLNISQCGKLKSLPHQLGRLKSLKSLTIGGLTELKSLPRWLVQLKALEDLAISDCMALRSLPRWLKDLPLLRCLSIHHCPLLSERYKKEGGDDWSKILQIPWIIIDGKYI